ncbi:LuxR C-terminal-related transcriptional regulator [Arthrobacter sp. UYP6]|uniref:LuxR C-terminal-related transcriptional regulator n=1 Tax=Arthrobacter sp. UYP6 TaxID=1756378 RepID=UPI0033958EE5
MSELAGVLESDRGGAVAVGPLGIGKTALVRAAAANPAFHVVGIRGSRVSGQTPFGALAWLISGLPDDMVSRPAQLLQELETLLRERAGGKRLLLLLDGAEHLDDLTAMVISQLVRRSAVKVLATAENLLGSAPELLSLWTDGLLHRIDLAPLTLEHTRELMESILAGRVSLIAAQALQHHSGGNPHLATLLTRDQARGGTLVQRNGVWVLANRIAFSGQVAEVITVRLQQLAPAERSLVQLLALADELPLATVLQLIPAETVDRLEEERMAEVTKTGTIRLTAHTSSTAIAGSVPPGRSRELWEEVSSILDPELLGPAAVAGFARWTLACNGGLDPETAGRAAVLAVDSGDPGLALQYIRSVPADRRNQAMVLTEVVALMNSGDYRGALDVLETLNAAAYPEDPDVWAELMRRKIVLLRALPGHGDPFEVLEEAYAVFSPGEPEPVRRKREAAVMLVHSALALDSGRLGDVPKGLAAGVSDSLLPPALRVQATALQAQFLALSGRGHEVMELLDSVSERLNDDLPSGIWETVNPRFFQALVASGEYVRALELLDRSLCGVSRDTFRGSSGEVVTGMVHALAGRADQARVVLASSIGQLQMTDPTDLLPLAQTLAAYVHLLLDNPAHAKQEVSEVAAFRYVAGAQRQLLIDLLQVQADLAGEPQQLCSELRSMARRRLEQGMLAPALDCLAAAVRHGDSAAAAELALAAAQADGRWARGLYCLGAGLDQEDPALLVESAQAASLVGNALMANTAAGAALPLLASRRDAESRELARNARKIEHLSFRELRDANTVQALMDNLSPFEADLARRAAGHATRAEISDALHLSPRTIDWHLGKIFDKLHVAGRSELGEVLVQG